MPVVHEIWDLRGTQRQNLIIRETLARVDFPWAWLKDGLRNSVNRETIPVEWDDLSRYAKENEEAHKEAEKADKDGLHSVAPPKARAHGSDADYHLVGYRNRVLGLAWYSGKVTLEQSLVDEPELAGEVFMSEGAHMVDFFYMNDEHRAGVWNAFHHDSEDVSLDTLIEDGVPIGHNHGWFDVGGYYSWVGEAFMGGFVKAFSDLPVTIEFDHPTTPEVAKEIRGVFGLADEPEDTPVTPEPEPETPEEPTAPEVPEEPTVPEEPVAPEEPDEGPTNDTPDVAPEGPEPREIWEVVRDFLLRLIAMFDRKYEERKK